MKTAWAKDTKRRIVATSVVAALILAVIMQALDAAGGHPAQNAPIYDAAFLFIIILPLRLLVRAGRNRQRRRNEETRPHP